MYIKIIYENIYIIYINMYIIISQKQDVLEKILNKKTDFYF